ncbi:hypothetical protein Sango_1178000 [Sesamum angolense]|uniref:Uncharacterized protein n=1 Tax=Sesamum angolense TaxID=2727404 RepID=A0AAE1WVY0_9LAMI|nr:hypothetical protein Sango_1178000 [Sesamum angolense]
MHIEKNVFDNIFNTVTDIKGKLKDNLNARTNLKIIYNCQELEFDERRPNVMPKTVYTLTKEKKRRVCEWMHGVKSYDCHVFMQKLVPVAFHEMRPELYQHHHSDDPIINRLVLTEFNDWFKRRVHPELNYMDNEQLKSRYWGPNVEVTLVPCYFVNGLQVFHGVKRIR